MNLNIIGYRNLNIFADEHNNLVIFSSVKNPNYRPLLPDEWPSRDNPARFDAKTPFELSYPYTENELAETLIKGFDSWDNVEPYKGKATLPEHYYRIKGYKNATRGKKLLSISWGEDKKSIRVYFPMKQKDAYLQITEITLATSATINELTKALMDSLQIDLTQCNTYKTFKGRLNI